MGGGVCFRLLDGPNITKTREPVWMNAIVVYIQVEPPFFFILIIVRFRISSGWTNKHVSRIFVTIRGEYTRDDVFNVRIEIKRARA